MAFEGVPRGLAGKRCGMESQVLSDWVHRFNAEGPKGLKDSSRGGGPIHSLSPEQIKKVEEGAFGASPLVYGLVRWRVADLHQCLVEECGVKVCEATKAPLNPHDGGSRLPRRG